MHPILKYVLANEVYHHNYKDFEVEIHCPTPTPGANMLTLDNRTLIYDKWWLEALVYYVYNEQWVSNANQLLKTDAEIFDLAQRLKISSSVELMHDPVYYIYYMHSAYW